MEFSNNENYYIKIQNKSLFSINFKVEYILLGKVIVQKSKSISSFKNYKIDLPKNAQSIILTVYKHHLLKDHLFYYEKLKKLDSKCYEVSGTTSKTICQSVTCN